MERRGGGGWRGGGGGGQLIQKSSISHPLNLFTPDMSGWEVIL